MNRIVTVTLLAGLLTPLALIAAEPSSADAAAAQAQAEAEFESNYKAMVEEAERAREQAETARKEAMKASELAREAARLDAQQARAEARQTTQQAEQAARERGRRQQELEHVREELSKAHRELREAQREVARAHREVSRANTAKKEFRVVNLGDRAVIGVVLGSESTEGVKIVGVSPDGPAERAGIRAGDILVSLNGENLAGSEHKGRESIYRVMDTAKAGVEMPVTLLRDGKTRDVTLIPEQREPLAWQSMISIAPEAPDAADLPDVPGVSDAPNAPNAPKVSVERIVVPQVDTREIEMRIQQLNKNLRSHKFTVVVPDDVDVDENGDFEFPESFDFEFQGYSDLAEQAMHDANIWFGLPLSQGLELATINEGLGAYFKTDRGVLVVRAKDDNAYQLKSGDVVLKINETAVDTPADMMRALREVEPGTEVGFDIKRDRKDKSITVTMPEDRLGYSWSVDSTR
ncbi:MAG: PDZ domain-containing protein [Lysobacterales bacterium]|jgi:C-terminal processing protease CtpA/Prc